MNDQTRQKRLAAALRANLRRRKAAAADAPAADPPADVAPPAPDQPR